MIMLVEAFGVDISEGALGGIDFVRSGAFFARKKGNIFDDVFLVHSC